MSDVFITQFVCFILYSLSLFFDEFISPFVIHGSLTMDLCGIVTSFSNNILFSSLLIFSMKAL